MDSVASASSPSSPRPHVARRITRAGWLLLAIAFVVYGVVLARHMGAYAGGSDSSGYMNHARLLGYGHVHVAPRTIPGMPTDANSRWMYSALGFKPAPDGDGIVPTYPTGLPIMILATAKIVGWARAGNVIMWIHAMLGVLVTYAAGRTFGLARRTSIIAAVMIGGSPLYLFMAVQAMSDVPALVWVTAAIAGALRSRERTAWAVGAGFAFAMAVLIRPTNLLAIIPIGLALGLSWRRWVALGLGGLPGAIFFCLHTHAAYGKYLTTGYGDSAGLETEYIGPTLLHYARWLPVMFTPGVIAFLALPAVIRRYGRPAVVLLTWGVVYAAFYSTYYFTHTTWWYLRFMLPAAPALVIGGLLVFEAVCDRRRDSARWSTVAVCAGLAVAFSWNAIWSKRLESLACGEGERTYPLVTAWLNTHLPADAVVAVMQHSGAIYYYTDFTFVRWDSMEPKVFAQLTKAVTAAHRPLYAALSPFEIADEQAFAKHMTSGTWTQIGLVRDVTIWKWSPEPAQAVQ